MKSLCSIINLTMHNDTNLVSKSRESLVNCSYEFENITWNTQIVSWMDGLPQC